MEPEPPAPTVDRVPLRTARKGDRLFFTNTTMPIVFRVLDKPAQVSSGSAIGYVMLSSRKGLFSAPFGGSPKQVISKLRFEWATQMADIVRASDKEGEE